MYRPRVCNRAVLALVCLGGLLTVRIDARAAGPGGSGVQTLPTANPTPPLPEAAPTDLDTFMEKVLARRDVNRRMRDEYVLDEAERFEILGPGRTPLHRSQREYTWYVRDGMHVRSPLRFNGVTLGEEARQRYETDWIRREQARRERRATKDAAAGDAPGEVTISPGGLEVSGAALPTEPRFVSEAYFLDFKFEPGNYYLAGRERLEGHEVLRIEYYPTRMFGEHEEQREQRAGESSRRGRRGSRADPEREDRERNQDIERRINKTALVTLWVDPAEHQIVKYTFENVWLDFLPGAWLVRMDEIRASMTMGQPFPEVWLPRGMQVQAGVTLATGSFDIGYGREFSGYRLAEVKTRIGPPRGAALRPPEPRPDHRFTSAAEPSRPVRPFTAVAEGSWAHAGDQQSGPFLVEEPQAAPGVEIVGEVRVHGSAFVSDADVLAIAGVSVGEPLPADGPDRIARRLRDSGHFESVDVRKRYRSLTNTSDVAILLVVHERPGVRSRPADVPGLPNIVTQPAARLRSKLMFLPVLGYADGYGVTYGGRVSTVGLLGAGERLSVPLTWGGTRRAALEFERLFRGGPLTRIDSSLAVWSRENPRFELRDRRVELKGRAERVFADLVRIGVEGSRSTISFGTLDDRLWTLGTSVALDTRADPAFPANAVFLGSGWAGLHFASAPRRINRYTADARGYGRIYRQAVGAGRIQYTGADATLPPYERLLLGGSPTLRGFPAGAFDGDRTLVSSAELRIPLTSVLSGAKLGVTAFVDAARVWDHGRPMSESAWHRGAGAGLFLIASVVRINLDVARDLHTRRTRVHLTSGFAF